MWKTKIHTNVYLQGFASKIKTISFNVQVPILNSFYPNF
jgi:hypothetical protein